MKPKILILTEAGKNIGFGHYIRCQSLQQNLNKHGFITQTILHLNEYNELETEARVFNWKENKEELLKYNDYENVVIDSYLADEPFYFFLKRNFKIVIVIDDYNRISYDADLIINPNVFFEEINYNNQKAKAIGGKNYIILRDEFRVHNLKPKLNQTVEHILITIGGSDFRNILPSIIDIVLKTDISKITIIAPDNHIKQPQNNRVKLVGLQNSESMLNLYYNSDIVLSACGQTLHELASIGKATVAICLDIDQKPNQQFYLKKGFLQADIGWDDKKLEAKIKSAINNLFSVVKRQAIANFSTELVNRNGVEQIVKSLNEVINSKNESIQQD